MGGAPIAAGQTAVTVLAQPTPFPPAKLSVFVFEDDFPLNGEQDGGGGVDVLSPNEPGLGGFNITLLDDAGGTGDATGQMTYDMFNLPLSNSLAGTIDPATGNGCVPDFARIASMSTDSDSDVKRASPARSSPARSTNRTAQTLSPLAGQAVVANLMPGRYGVVATPGADRIAQRRRVAPDQHPGRPEGPRFLPPDRRAELTSRSSGRRDTTCPSALPTRRSSMAAWRASATAPTLTSPARNCTNTVTGMVTDRAHEPHAG